MDSHGHDTQTDDAQGAGPLKKPRIYREAEKVQHTTHWDMDYLPLKEVEALYKAADSQPASNGLRPSWLKKENLARFFKRLPPWLVLLIVILLFGRFAVTLVFHLSSPLP